MLLTFPLISDIDFILALYYLYNFKIYKKGFLGTAFYII